MSKVLKSSLGFESSPQFCLEIECDLESNSLEGAEFEASQIVVMSRPNLERLVSVINVSIPAQDEIIKNAVTSVLAELQSQ